MAQVAFGLFDWIDRGTVPLHQLYEERLQLLEAADAANFFCYHLAEHHATPLGMAPSPALFLTAAAQRTRRIRLGPLVYLLPLYNPLRLIEEVCMLDHLSGGRLELGVGRGVTPYELRYFGVDPAGTRATWYRSIIKLWHDHDDHSCDGLFAWEPSLQNETILFGSPARVREQIGRLVEASGCNYVICAFAWGTLPHEHTLCSLRLFVEEVMPAFSGSATPVA